jgi:hypothetical protein
MTRHEAPMRPVGVIGKEHRSLKMVDTPHVKTGRILLSQDRARKVLEYPIHMIARGDKNK